MNRLNAAALVARTIHGRAFSASKVLGVAVVLSLLLPTFESQALAGATVILNPGDNVISIINSKPSGTSFLFKSGMYRGFQITPKSNTTFTGEPGAILSGSRALTNWSSSGGLWKHGGQNQNGERRGNCESGQACTYPEDIYVNDLLLQQVLKKSDVKVNTFYFDYGANEVWIGQNPAGKVVEIGYVEDAFSGGSSGIVVDGLIIEKYANPAQHGAIHMKKGDTLSSGWTVRNTEVRWNHGTGIKIGTNSVVSESFIHHNGQLGIGSGAGKNNPRGANNLVENNEISYNTTVPFLGGFEVGGTKFARDKDLVVRGNFVHNNNGPGLWCDVECLDPIFDNNIVAFNQKAGIFFEISYGTIIRNNLVIGNGLESDWMYGAGILIAHSPDAEVYNNTVIDNGQAIIGVQQTRGSGSFGAHEVRNLKVHDNVIVSSGAETGIGRSGSSNNNIFTSWGNKFYDNTYYFDNLNAKYFRWKYSAMTESQWQSNGNDQAGTWLSRSTFVMPTLPPEGQGWTGPGGGGGGGGGESATFSDISGSIFEADIEWLAARGITKGCNPPTNTRFCPDDRVTRGQMAAFLDRALNLPSTSKNYFTDDNGSSFEGAINRLAAAGITAGCNAEGTKFCSSDTVTRGQMAAFLTRALGYSNDGGGDLFLDDDTSEFELEIDRLATAGVTKGCNPPINDRFCPNSAVTRGQMAAFLRRALG